MVTDKCVDCSSCNSQDEDISFLLVNFLVLGERFYIVFAVILMTAVVVVVMMMIMKLTTYINNNKWSK